jgi:hypothetical protein
MTQEDQLSKNPMTSRLFARVFIVKFNRLWPTR